MENLGLTEVDELERRIAALEDKTSLETRIGKLEAGAARRVITVDLYEGETHAEALAHAGIEPGPRDLVVFLRMFSRTRDGVSCDPRGLTSG